MSLQKELNTEIGSQHPIWGLKPIVFAKSDANDDVLVYLDDGRFANVHLIWHGHIEQQAELYPSAKIFSGIVELQAFINSESQNYT